MKYYLLSIIFILFSQQSRRIINFLITFCVAGVLLTSFSLFSIEVGGHLTEDTTWSPDNNPYQVIENVYVDEGITLTILPGVEIQVTSASCTSWQELSQNFWLTAGSSNAKFIQVDGRIIAKGTLQDSIFFTRLQNDPNYYWGTIYLNDQASLCEFSYCNFEYSCAMGMSVGGVAFGTISFKNGLLKAKNNRFLNNASGIVGTRRTKEVEIIDNYFGYNDDINSFVLDELWRTNIQVRKPFENYQPALIAKNECIGKYVMTVANPRCVDNNIIGDYSTGISCVVEDGPGYFFNNIFETCSYGIFSNDTTEDSIYVKHNNFFNGYHGVRIDYGHIEICDNYFEGCDLDTGLNTTGMVFDNIINDGNVLTSAYLDVFQNIGYNGYYGITITYRNESCFNNLSVNNVYAFNGVFSNYYNNCIFLNNDELSQNGVHGNPIFRNCIIDFPLDPPLIDGGGNIIVDPIQAQSIFEDIQNGNFHLAPGSIAIDAGFDTLGYYYPFDLDYNQRVWDGDNNGTAIIDIGPYEYGAPALGGIQGITFNSINGDPVDYVLIKINNEPGEFTFSDSIGTFVYKLPAGIYDVYAERVFYDDAIEYQIEVVEGELTQLDIPMYEIVSVVEPIVPNSSSQISNLSNYPNPFNPSTTISFSIQYDIKAELSIFNIKGQKITTLINEHLSKGKHSIVWSGKDQNGNFIGSGIYLYKIKVGKQESVKRMLLLK